MADKQQEEEEDSKVNSPQPPPFLEVTSNTLGKVSRFAAGTKAGFAVSLINTKFETGSSYIEAVKDGEEPISFGPDALLVNYGHGWKLRAVSVSHSGAGKTERIRLIPAHESTMNTDGTPMSASESGFGSVYIAKVLLAFVMIFVLGAIFTVALENLPQMLLLINSYI
ncbi:uncharacterized protein LOC126666261 [Mercurialis annua]|uniref:uncharacterized protein LOC126666261 n=1 Tax=Mercurialis annua TaxID=3986 RepID=UPI0021605896|nr:uncharacterized protein LOC126666261 [Mercurialis annua]